jgi:hypothetical protein
MNKLPCKHAELFKMLKVIIEQGDEHVDGGFDLDIGGQIINARISEPFQIKPPLATIRAPEWGISFYYPKEFSPDNHVRYASSVSPKVYFPKNMDRVAIMDVTFSGNEESFLRDITFAKMMA